MGAQDQFTLSTSILLHASLAAVSPEVLAIDSMTHPRQTSNSYGHKILPLELMLVIREHLVPMIIDDLLSQSHRALEEYQVFRRKLLCPDCRAYNEDVYGLDVWNWEQCTGPCPCRERVSRTILAIPNYLTDVASYHFVDRLSWLETYLSKQINFSFRSRLSSQSIRQLTQDNLRLHACAMLQPADHRTPGDTLAALQGSLIAILVPAEASSTSNDSMYDLSSTSNPSIAVGRAIRDLGLDYYYNDLPLEQKFCGELDSRLRLTPEKGTSAEGAARPALMQRCCLLVFVIFAFFLSIAFNMTR